MFKKLLDWMFTSNEEFRLNAEVDRISQELTKAYKDLYNMRTALVSEKEKCEKLEAEKGRAWTKLESTEDALEILNEKLNKEIIEKETMLVAWEKQAEKEKAQLLTLKKRASKAEKLSKELDEELSFTVAELQKTKVSLLATREPTNLEIAALIYNKQAVTCQEAVAQAIELRKASTNLEQGDVEPKNS
jgi:predicted  nucleic acid-binding Zn-ribbon protein